MEILTVKEYDTIMNNPEYEDRYAYLPDKPFSTLLEFVHGFEGDNVNSDVLEFCRIGFRRGVGETVSVSNYVGTIQTGSGYQIEILPKVSLQEGDQGNEGTKRIFLQMLRSMHGFPGKVLSDAKLKVSKMNLYEIFIRMYVEGVKELVKKGLKSAYVGREENLTQFKGKLLIRNHIRYNLTHKERFYVGYDEYHVNRPENRIIKATLEKLLRVSKSASVQREIRELLISFELVEPSINHATEFSKITLDRSTRQYEEVLSWSKVFLLNESFSTFSGNANAKSLLFPMEKVFESYVAKKLKRALADTGWQVKAQAWGKYLFEDPRKFALSPDIVIKRDDNSVVILDTKWKVLNDNPGQNYGISQSDMYQMFAYSHRYGTPEIWLLYPINEKVRGLDSIEYRNDDPVRVRVFFVDLENMDQSMAKLRSLLMKKEDTKSMDTPEFVRNFINNQSWVFAKTYAEKAPHEYVVRGKQNGSDEDFMAVVDYIAEHGITMYFWNHPNKYIFVDGRQYWVMKDSDDDPTMVLNRCDLSQYKLSIEWMGKQKG